MDVEDDPDNNDGTFFPCEFCGDPYPCEFLMRHQMSCDLNPAPVSSGQGFDYRAIKRNIAENSAVPAAPPKQAVGQASQAGQAGQAGQAAEAGNSRESRRLSRSNSVVERSYSRSNIRRVLAVRN